MRTIRIMIASGFSAFFRRGGGEYELEEVAKVFRDLGWTSQLYGPHSDPLETFDVVIYASTHVSGLELFNECIKLDKPIIFWPNYWPNGTLSDTVAYTIKKFYDNSIFTVFKSKSEYEELSKIVSLYKGKNVFINWGVDKSILEPAKPEVFKKIYSLNSYVIIPGLLEPVKNQLNIIKALNNETFSMVFIGGYRSRSYYNSCKEIANQNCLFLPALEARSEMLRSAYSGAIANVEVSYDPPGSSAYEAAIMGLPLVLSKMNWNDEAFGRYYFPAYPDNIQSIKDATHSAIVSNTNLSHIRNKIIKLNMYPAALNTLIDEIKKII